MVEDDLIRIEFVSHPSGKPCFHFLSFPEWARGRFNHVPDNVIARVGRWCIASDKHPEVDTRRLTLWCPGKHRDKDHTALFWGESIELLEDLLRAANFQLAMEGLKTSK